jgi:hypothetical protein
MQQEAVKTTREWVPVGETTVLGNGTRVEVVKRKKPKKRRSFGATAIHEARHAVTAEANGTSVVYATIIPGPGYLGLTQLSSYDAAAVAAPHAHGDDGTSGDEAILAQEGHSVEGAGAKARAILADKSEQVEAVAEALQQKGSISGGTIRAIMGAINDDRFEVVMRIYPPDGKTTERVAESGEIHNDTVVLLSELVRPRKADLVTESDFQKDSRKAA